MMSGTDRSGGLRFYLAQVLSAAICEPKLRLGRRRHDNICDECGANCGSYAMDKLDFPLEDLGPEESSSLEKLRAMFGAEYLRVCLECSEDMETDGSDTGENQMGADHE